MLAVREWKPEREPELAPPSESEKNKADVCLGESETLKEAH